MTVQDRDLALKLLGHTQQRAACAETETQRAEWNTLTAMLLERLKPEYIRDRIQ